MFDISLQGAGAVICAENCSERERQPFASNPKTVAVDQDLLLDSYGTSIRMSSATENYVQPQTHTPMHMKENEQRSICGVCCEDFTNIVPPGFY